MNLLIVDDDKYVVEDIQDSIAYVELGIEGVYTAYNVFQAYQIIEKHPISIIMADIDMPGGTGLDLLKQVRENHQDIEVFFITCHADFHFSQQAIHLGCLDYLLKPLDYEEVENIIKQAVIRIKDKKRLKDTIISENYFEMNKKSITEQFLLDIIWRKLPLNEYSISRAAEKRNIKFLLDNPYYPVLISSQYDNEMMGAAEKYALDFALLNIGEELLTEWGQKGIIFRLEQKSLLCMLYNPKERETPFEVLNKKLKVFISVCHKYCFVSLSCYVGEEIKIFELAQQTEKLKYMSENNLAYLNKVFYLNKAYYQERFSHTPDILSWYTFIINGYSDRVLYEIEQYLKGISENHLISLDLMTKFQQDLLQILYKALASKDLPAHVLFETEKMMGFYKNSTHSLNTMLEWCKEIFAVIKKLFHTEDKLDDRIRKVTAYIHANLQKELTRGDIAKQLYIHPDYLDRLFKKKLNMSVTKYIFMERMNYAKLLLTETELSISEIGNCFGYNNLSNFSAMFKKIEGITPVEYRKQKIGRKHC